MSGGGFGPEDSIINVVIMAVVFVGMMYFAQRQKLIISMPKTNLAYLGAAGTFWKAKLKRCARHLPLGAP